MKKTLRIISFLLLLAVFLFASSWMLRDRQTTLACLYSEPDNSLDVIIVGSSHVNSGYIPNILWQENNAAACNVFSWSQPIWVSYHYIKEALRSQSPKVVVLDLFGATYGHSYIVPEEIDKTSYANSFQMDLSLNFFEMLTTVERCGIDLRNYEDFLNIPRYHTRWKQFSLNMLSYNPHKMKDPLKGYGLGLATAPFEIASAQDTEPQVPYEYCVEYLDKIVDLCKKEDIKLIFTLTPYVYGEQEPPIYSWLSQYAKQNNIVFLNYNGADGDRVGFDAATDLQDMGHVNLYGAQKITNDLSDYLKKNFDFGTKEQHSNYVQLNNDYITYQRILSVQDILVESDTETFFNMLSKDSQFTVFGMYSGNLPKTEEKIRNMLSQDGEVPQTIQSIIWRPGSSPEYNQPKVEFSLFDKKGSVRFDYEGKAIYLNEVAAPRHGDIATFVLYDHVLQRPIDVAYINSDKPDTVSHREFTSDILPSYRVR